MGFLKSRNGKGFYYARALSGYLKILFNRKNNNDENIGELNNTMKVKFKVE